jgi:putative salt-induced outer membrane protein YdiY
MDPSVVRLARMFHSVKKTILFCIALVAAGFGAFAQSAPTAPLFVAPHSDTGWLSSAALGLSVAKGNTDNQLYTGNLLTSRRWDIHEADFGANGQYGETGGTESVANARGFGQYNRLFTERFFGMFRAEGLYDGIADIEYRVTLSPGVGYYLIKSANSTNTFLRFETGPSFIWEKLDGEPDRYVTLRLAERFERTLNSHVRLWESVEYLPSFNNFAKYIVNAEIGVEASLTKRTSLRVYLQDSYESDPAPGRKNNDVKLVAALAYKL